MHAVTEGPSREIRPLRAHACISRGDAARVAHKTGNITKHNHDAAIVYAPGRKPYVIVVLTKGIAEQKRSARLIADISRVVYQAMAR